MNMIQKIIQIKDDFFFLIYKALKQDFLYQKSQMDWKCQVRARFWVLLICKYDIRVL